MTKRKNVDVEVSTSNVSTGAEESVRECPSSSFTSSGDSDLPAILFDFVYPVDVNPVQLFTPDVVQQSLFLDILRMSDQWRRFESVYTTYHTLDVRGQRSKSILKDKVQEMKACLDDVGKHLKKIADTRISSANVLSFASLASAQEKAQLLRETALLLPRLKS